MTNVITPSKKFFKLLHLYKTKKKKRGRKKKLMDLHLCKENRQERKKN